MYCVYVSVCAYISLMLQECPLKHYTGPWAPPNFCFCLTEKNSHIVFKFALVQRHVLHFYSAPVSLVPGLDQGPWLEIPRRLAHPAHASGHWNHHAVTILTKHGHHAVTVWSQSIYLSIYLSMIVWVTKLSVWRTWDWVGGWGCCGSRSLLFSSVPLGFSLFLTRLLLALRPPGSFWGRTLRVALVKQTAFWTLRVSVSVSSVSVISNFVSVLSRSFGRNSFELQIQDRRSQVSEAQVGRFENIRIINKSSV